MCRVTVCGDGVHMCCVCADDVHVSCERMVSICVVCVGEWCPQVPSGSVHRVQMCCV